MIARLRPHLAAFVPGLAVVALMLVWAVHDGGYDADTWYWGALLLTAGLGGLLVWRGWAVLSLPRPLALALAAFAGYVAWSYLSITWAASPGDALDGSNRALLYLLVFAVVAVLPWTVEAARAALLVFVLGIGAVAVVLLVRLATGDHVDALVVQGRLAAPTGYFNGTAALFTIGALTAIVLAARRELPVLLRGALVGGACAGLQLAVIVQSRGWLFTLPLVAVAVVLVSRRRWAVLVAGGLVAACLAPNLHALLRVYGSSSTGAFAGAAERAGHGALVACVVAALFGWALTLLDGRLAPRAVSPGVQRALTAAVVAGALGCTVIGAFAVTHGDPAGFVSRQWHGFSHQQTVFASGSHFGDVGSGRYDFWRVALHAFAAHPVGGLGQDNFSDYYVTHRRTAEEPSWTHSLEMRLLVHTGLVGTGLFALFLVAGLVAALRSRRRDGAFTGAALVPLLVWLIHGSLDWFWEIPALTGPALGFLAMAGALAPGERVAWPVRWRAARPAVGLAGAGLGLAVLAAAVVALGLPYLAVREVSRASDLRASNPVSALAALQRAASFDPLSAEPGRVGGMVALQAGLYAEASQRFGQAIAREPGGWLAWLGAGLAASSQGDRATARADFAHAAAINGVQPAVLQALHDVDTSHPLTVDQAVALLVPVA